MAIVHRSQGAPTLYTAEEAAEILRVKKSWLERQAAARKIPFTMLGGSYRFTFAHLAAIVQMHEEARPRRRDQGLRHPLSAAQHGTAPGRPRVSAAAAPAP